MEEWSGCWDIKAAFGSAYHQETVWDSWESSVGPGVTILLESLANWHSERDEWILSCPHLPESQWDPSGPCHSSFYLLLGLEDIHTPSPPKEDSPPWKAVVFLRFGFYSMFIWHVFRNLMDIYVPEWSIRPFVSSKQVEIFSDYMNKCIVASSRPCTEWKI